MSPSLKKICVFGLSAGLGRMVLNQVHSLKISKEERDLVSWNAKEIICAGEKAIERCNVKIDKSKMKQAKKKIDQVCKDGGEFVIVEMLSFVFLGLNDLSHYCKDKDTIRKIEEAALNFTTLYDPNLEDESVHQTAMNRYRKWIEAA